MSYTFFSVRHFPKHGKTLSPRRIPLPLPLPLGLQISAIAKYPTHFYLFDHSDFCYLSIFFFQSLGKFPRYPTPRPKFLKSCAILKNDDEKVWSRTNARVGVKDVDSTVSGLSQNLSLYVQFSAPVQRGSKPCKEEEEKQDYMNMVTLFEP
ncbi:hypothetical protein PVK06_039492 [Gossypium arboreum]|uniref:Uncharacterized protein n=1 Tax=Gossypium arboreum TaxID=29729 RepID=A0ABR0N312_GOSAR|nr:hypothetical protein PVK06_039492 [Gossypium arboreum]